MLVAGRRDVRAERAHLPDGGGPDSIMVGIVRSKAVRAGRFCEVIRLMSRSAVGPAHAFR